jgi:hypothetical protein
LKAANGRIIADSGEGYKSEQECKADIDRVKASKQESQPGPISKLTCSALGAHLSPMPRQ